MILSHAATLLLSPEAGNVMIAKTHPDFPSAFPARWHEVCGARVQKYSKLPDTSLKLVSTSSNALRLKVWSPNIQAEVTSACF